MTNQNQIVVFQYIKNSNLEKENEIWEIKIPTHINNVCYKANINMNKLETTIIRDINSPWLLCERPYNRYLPSAAEKSVRLQLWVIHEDSCNGLQYTAVRHLPILSINFTSLQNFFKYSHNKYY